MDLGSDFVVFFVLVMLRTHELVHFGTDSLELLHFPGRLVPVRRLLVDSHLDMVLQVSHLLKVIIVELIVPTTLSQSGMAHLPGLGLPDVREKQVSNLTLVGPSVNDAHFKFMKKFIFKYL